MRAAVVGTGALGGFFAALLVRAGHDVVCLARGSQLEAVRTRGLTVKSAAVGEFTVPVRATDHADHVGPVELVLCCVKCYDLDAAKRLGRVLGDQAVVGGVCYVVAGVETPGVVRHDGGTRLIIGERTGGDSARIERVVEVLRVAGIAAEAAADIRVAIWEKFVGVCATGGVMPLTRLAIRSIPGCPETRAFFRATMAEVASLTHAGGISLSADHVDRVFPGFNALPPWAKSAMPRDVRTGRLELEALNGTAVWLGREYGLPTSANSAIDAALKPYVDGAPTLPRPS